MAEMQDLHPPVEGLEVEELEVEDGPNRRQFLCFELAAETLPSFR